jgi:hypothetical protein
VRQLEFALFDPPAIRASCDTLVVPVPADERPLRGEAGWVDWRVCGEISRQLASGYADGERGEAVLIPAPRPLAAARILLLGIGPARQLEGRVLQRAFCTLAEKLLALRAEQVVFAAPGAIDLELDAGLLARGCVQALADGQDGSCLRVGIAASGERPRALEQALSDLASDAHGRGVNLRLSFLAV